MEKYVRPCIICSSKLEGYVCDIIYSIYAELWPKQHLRRIFGGKLYWYLSKFMGWKNILVFRLSMVWLFECIIITYCILVWPSKSSIKFRLSVYDMCFDSHWEYLIWRSFLCCANVFDQEKEDYLVIELLTWWFRSKKIFFPNANLCKFFMSNYLMERNHVVCKIQGPASLSTAVIIREITI